MTSSTSITNGNEVGRPTGREVQKHAPGPWGAIGIPYGEYWIVPAEDVGLKGQPVRRIANVEGGRPIYRPAYDIETREANARLIAAAPEMLECLEKLYGYLVAMDEDGLTEHAEIMTRSREAINRARGTAP